MSTDKENKKQTEQTEKKDISNSLEKDAVGEKGSLNQTPQGRTDIEQEKEKKKND